jgi:hypothetical protein
VLGGKELALALSSLALPALGWLVLTFRPKWAGFAGVVPLDAKAEKLLVSFLILLSVGSFLGVIFLGNRASGASVRTSVTASELRLRASLDALEARTVSGEGSKRAQLPLLVYLESDEVPVVDRPVGKLRFSLWWYRFSYPAETVQQFEEGKIRSLPPLDPKSAVVITRGEDVERMIKLDIGAVPGYRVWNIVSVLDMDTGCLVAQSGKIWGPHVSDPSRPLGIHEISSVTGEDPDWTDVESVIRHLASPDSE